MDSFCPFITKRVHNYWSLQNSFSTRLVIYIILTIFFWFSDKMTGVYKAIVSTMVVIYSILLCLAPLSVNTYSGLVYIHFWLNLFCWNKVKYLIIHKKSNTNSLSLWPRQILFWSLRYFCLRYPVFVQSDPLSIR